MAEDRGLLQYVRRKFHELAHEVNEVEALSKRILHEVKKEEHREYRDRSTITTGPFLVPALNQDADTNDRLVIVLKNPTDDPLTATVVVDVTPGPTNTTTPFPTALPFTFTGAEVPSGIGGTFVVPANSSTRFESAIPIYTATVNGTTFNVNAVLRVAASGDFRTLEGQPVAGRLEIEVLGGTGNSVDVGGVITPVPGLLEDDPALFFPYSSFVVFVHRH